MQQLVFEKDILGKDGRRYNLIISERDSMFLIQLYDRQTLVGEARCIQESSETFCIGDIAIANAVVITPANDPANLYTTKLHNTKLYSTSLRRNRRVYRTRPINYRSRGLGSALLQCLIDHARAKGAQYLYGDVFRQDVENTPNLLQWYQKHGFDIRPLDSDEKPDVVAIVHLHFGHPSISESGLT